MKGQHANHGARKDLKQCQVCWKLYDPSQGWQAQQHAHQGSESKGRRREE